MDKAMAGPKKSRAKGRKIGRNKAFCEAYRRTGEHEKSHAKRILKHLKRYGGGDLIAKHALARYQGRSI